MRGLGWGIWVLPGILCMAGCRLPVWDGQISRPLATSRQLCQQGVAAMERDQWTRAEELLQRAVKTCANDPDSRRAYAEALWHRGAQADAVAQIEVACHLAPENAEFQVRAAELRLATRQIDAAIGHTRRAIELSPRLAPAWVMRGRIMAASGQLREALAAYHRALDYAPHDRGVQFEIAEVYRQLNEPQRALVVLQGLAETYPPGEEPPQLLAAEGLVYRSLARYDDAAEALAAAVRRQTPHSPELLCQWGDCLFAAGRAGEAVRAAEEALRLDPQYAPGRQLLARLETAQRPNAIEGK
jgi:tetratricopeptide (TPR) repeat protein